VYSTLYSTVPYVTTPAKIGTPGSAEILSMARTPAKARTSGRAEIKTITRTKATAGMPKTPGTPQ
jgi:hypothetical protein